MSTIGNLVVNFVGNAKPLQSTLSSVQSMVSGAYSTIAGILGAGLSIQAAREDSAAQKKLQAVLTATGYAAQLSAQQISEYASELQAVTNFSDETTVAAAALLATFRSIKGDVFKETLATAQDLSTVLGTDLESATMKLGKALQDPVQGIGSLHKLGVSFTEQQKDMIKSLVESGDTLGAQRVILDNIKGSYAGAAQAMASPFKVMNNLLNEIAEQIGRSLLVPMKYLANIVIPFLKEWGNQLAKVGLAVIVLVGILRAITVVQKAIAVGQALILALGGPAGWASLATGAAVFAGALYGINQQFSGMQTQIDATQAKFSGLAANAAFNARRDAAFFGNGGQNAKDEELQKKLKEEFGPKQSILSQMADANKAFGGQAPWFVREGIIEKASGIISKTAELKAEIDRLNGVATETDQAIAKMWTIEGISNAEKTKFENLMRQRDALLEQKKIMDDMKSEAKAIFEDTRTPLEKMEQRLSRIKDMFDKGLIDKTTRDRATAKARDDYLSSQKGSGSFAAATEAGSKEAYSLLIHAMGTQNESVQERIADAAEKQNEIAQESRDFLEELAQNNLGVEFVAMGVA